MKALTKVGRELSHSSINRLDHNIYGPFDTMEGFWYYIRSVDRDDRLRRTDGPLSRKLGQKLKSRRDPSFKWLIADANWQRVMQSPKLKDLLVKSTLPFDLYYLERTNIDHHIPIRPTYAYWLVYVFEEIRAALKENREPDFSVFGENPNKEIVNALSAKHAPVVQEDLSDYKPEMSLEVCEA